MPRIKLNSLLDDAKQALEPVEATLDQPEHRAQEPVHGQLPLAVDVEAPVDAPETSLEPIATEDVSTEPATLAPSSGKAPRRAAPRRGPEKAQPERVHYATLVRKEARLRDDQIESLTLRARRLSRNKAVTDQRITDNTLIRIAVDLLLAKENDLAGTSEAELRKSVGL